MNRANLTTNPAFLIGTTPSGPRTVSAETPESIAAARAFKWSARLAALDNLVNDPDGSRALAAVLRGDIR